MPCFEETYFDELLDLLNFVIIFLSQTILLSLKAVLHGSLIVFLTLALLDRVQLHLHQGCRAIARRQFPFTH